MNVVLKSNGPCNSKEIFPQLRLVTAQLATMSQQYQCCGFQRPEHKIDCRKFRRGIKKEMRETKGEPEKGLGSKHKIESKNISRDTDIQ